MLSTPHLLVGAACGIISKDPILAFSSGFVSHLVLDFIPHHDQTHYWSYKIYPKLNILISLLDFTVGITLLYVFLHTKPYEVIIVAALGAFGGFFLDFVDEVIGEFLWKGFRDTLLGSYIHRFHIFFHTSSPAHRWLLGIFTQIGSSFGSMIALYFI